MKVVSKQVRASWIQVLRNKFELVGHAYALESRREWGGGGGWRQREKKRTYPKRTNNDAGNDVCVISNSTTINIGHPSDKLLPDRVSPKSIFQQCYYHCLGEEKKKSNRATR